MHMLSAQNNTDYKRMLRIFEEALDLQEHISVSLHQPEEVQKLVERSHAEEVIRWNAQTVATRLRVLADDILYHRLPTRFTMEKQIGALEKSPASIRIILLGNSAIGTSAASLVYYAPKTALCP